MDICLVCSTERNGMYIEVLWVPRLTPGTLLLSAMMTVELLPLMPDFDSPIVLTVIIELILYSNTLLGPCGNDRYT